MALKAKITSLDAVPAALRSEYTLGKDGYYLDVDGVDDVPSVRAAVGAAEDYFLDQEIVRALGSVNGIPALIGHEMRSNMRAKRVQVNGKLQFVAEVVRNGVPRIRDSAGSAFNAKDLALELKQNPAFAAAFSDSGADNSSNRSMGDLSTEDLQRIANGEIRAPVSRVQQTQGGVVRVDPAKIMDGSVKVDRIQ